MRLTVCELSDDPSQLASEWSALTEHLRQQRSDAVVLPEMPFFPWFANSPTFDPEIWSAALLAHDTYVARLGELGVPNVLSTRPLARADSRLNQGFVWDGAYRASHEKRMFPNEVGYMEAVWFDPGDPVFPTTYVGDWRVGFLICTELWFFDRARHYGLVDGVELL